MSNCKHIEQMLPDYHDGALSERDRNEVAGHLAGCSACAALDRDLQRTVNLLSQLPVPEPRLDLWQEFAPKMDAVEAEMGLKPVARWRRWWQHAVAHVAEGLVLYTQAVARRTLLNMERYLIRDPFRVSE